MYVCLEYQSILHEKINSASLKKSTMPPMFQARKWTCHNSTSRESQEKMFWRAKRMIFRTRIYWRRRTFESLALNMCHFLLDVHGRAQIIAS